MMRDYPAFLLVYCLMALIFVTVLYFSALPSKYAAMRILQTVPHSSPVGSTPTTQQIVSAGQRGEER